mmetsp:Transcript_124549/g.357736  ORF Transcript_124549/g.357736 Transcript_124549/m.357736 type:complete len:319 (+) Transcript_124549:675-1631(+)
MLREKHSEAVDHQRQEHHGPKECPKRADDQVEHLLQLRDEPDHPQQAQDAQQPQDLQQLDDVHIAHQAAAPTNDRAREVVQQVEHDECQVEVIPAVSGEERSTVGDESQDQLEGEHQREHDLECRVPCGGSLVGGACVCLDTDKRRVREQHRANGRVEGRAANKAARPLRDPVGGCVLAEALATPDAAGAAIAVRGARYRRRHARMHGQHLHRTLDEGPRPGLPAGRGVLRLLGPHRLGELHGHLRPDAPLLPAHVPGAALDGADVQHLPRHRRRGRAGAQGSIGRRVHRDVLLDAACVIRKATGHARGARPVQDGTW